MIKLERNRDKYFVMANDKILLATKDFRYAQEVLHITSKNNDLTYASRTFIPSTLLDPTAER